MGRKPTWTDEQFLTAVRGAFSIAGTCRALGIVPVGGNYHTIRAAVARLGADTSHWAGQAWNRGRRHGLSKTRRPLDQLLRAGVSYPSSKLHRRLLIEGGFARQCADCGLHEWRGRPIPLELDHINGVHTDNRRENLRLVCPNCHALSSTWRGRNIGRRRTKPPTVAEPRAPVVK